MFIGKSHVDHSIHNYIHDIIILLLMYILATARSMQCLLTAVARLSHHTQDCSYSAVQLFSS